MWWCPPNSTWFRVQLAFLELVKAVKVGLKHRTLNPLSENTPYPPPPVCPCRQRIASYKEIMRLSGLPSRTPEQESRLKVFQGSYEYDGNATCAADGMCQEKCPVKINTGEQAGLLLLLLVWLAASGLAG